MSIFNLNVTLVDNKLLKFLQSFYVHCMVKSHRILKFSFSTTPSGSCSYQRLALLNPSFSQNCHCAHLPTLSCLLLYSFWASLPHSLTIWVSFLYHTSYILGSFVNVVLDIVSSYRLFLDTTYQSLGASFWITFSYSSPCVVLILVLHISSKLFMHCFCSPFIFLCSSLVFLNASGSIFSSCVIVLLVLTATSMFWLQLVMVLYCFWHTHFFNKQPSC